MKPTQDINIVRTQRLISPLDLKRKYSITDPISESVYSSRAVIRDILDRKDSRVLVVVGPCSIHDYKGAIEFARRLNDLRQEVSKHFFLVMRVYFEKPRTTIGWKGLINDPHLDGSYDMAAGLEIARKLLLEIGEMGLPTGTEFLEPITPQYIADLLSWAAIGARTTESQTHREMASGLSMPIGFKNGTDGSLQIAIDAMGAARHPHSFLGIDESGVTSIIQTKGNQHGHIVLRGGNKRTNFDRESIEETVGRLTKADLPPVVMVDCSHANSNKQPAKQEVAWQSVLDQRVSGDLSPVGLMLESYLFEGNQPISKNPAELKYGVSITDPCLDWETTERLIRSGHAQLERAGR